MHTANVLLPFVQFFKEIRKTWQKQGLFRRTGRMGRRNLNFFKIYYAHAFSSFIFITRSRIPFCRLITLFPVP
jgi:hypothetical protein